MKKKELLTFNLAFWTLKEQSSSRIRNITKLYSSVTLAITDV